MGLPHLKNPQSGLVELKNNAENAIAEELARGYVHGTYGPKAFVPLILDTSLINTVHS